MAKVNGKYLNDIAGDLPEALQREYAIVKASYLAHKATANAFEAKLRQHLGVGTELKVWYRFGQLSVSLGEPKPERIAKPKQSLSDWLAQQH